MAQSDDLAVSQYDARDRAAPGPWRTALAFVRTRIFDLAILIVSLAAAAAILTYYQIRRTPKEVRILLRMWTVSFIWAARFILGTRWRLEGLENIPEHPVIFVSNHQSYWESIALTVFIKDVNIVTKRASMQIPVFGWGLRHAPMIPVDRDMPGQNIRRMCRDARRSLTEGRSILIFPEGTRVDPGQSKPFERGFEMLYRTCNAEVVPIVVNAGKVWKRGFGTKHPGLITMRFLPARPAGQNAADFVAEMEETLRVEKEKLP